MKNLKKVLSYLLIFSLVLSYAIVPTSAITVKPTSDDNGKVLYIGYDVLGCTGEDRDVGSPLEPSGGNYKLDENNKDFYIAIKFAGNPTDLDETLTAITLVFNCDKNVAVPVAAVNGSISPSANLNLSETECDLGWTSGDMLGIVKGVKKQIVDSGTLCYIYFESQSDEITCSSVDNILKLKQNSGNNSVATKAVDHSDKNFTIKEAPAIDKVELDSSKKFTTKSTLDDVKAAISSFTFVNSDVEMVTYDNNTSNSSIYSNLNLAIKGGENLIEGDNTITATYENQTFDFVINCEAATYKVAFDNNGGEGTMEDQTFTFGTSQNLKANAFTKTDFKFVSWNTKSDGTGTSYAGGAEVTDIAENAGETVTLYAIWKEKKNLTPSDFSVTNNNDTFNINGNTADVAFVNSLDPACSEDITVKYKLDDTGDFIYTPKAVGTYNIYVSVKGDNNYKDATDLKLSDTLTISALETTINLNNASASAANSEGTTVTATINKTTEFNILLSNVSSFNNEYYVELEGTSAGVTIVKGTALYSFKLSLASTVTKDTIIPVKITIPSYNYPDQGDTEVESTEKSKTIYIKATPKTVKENSDFGVDLDNFTYKGEAVAPTPTNLPSGVDADKVSYAYYKLVDGSQPEALGSAPVDAGKYRVVATCEDDNYIYEASKDYTISKKEVTITANDVTATYGTKNDGFAFLPSGIINSETYAEKVEGEVYYIIKKNADDVTYADDTDAGTYTIVPDVSKLTAYNYYFTAVNGTLTINKKQITADKIVYAGTPNNSKVYDGTRDANASYVLESDVKVETDDIGINVVSQTYDSATAGENKDITAKFSLDGTDNGNYTLYDGSNNVCDLTKTFTGGEITKKDLSTVTDVTVHAQDVAIINGEFNDPEYTLVLKEDATDTNPVFNTDSGLFTYSGKIGSTELKDKSHNDVVTEIKKLSDNATINLTFKFKPKDTTNFENSLSGTLTLNASNLAFYQGSTSNTVSEDNIASIVSIPSTVAYGKTWSEIITAPVGSSSELNFKDVKGITAKIGDKIVDGTYYIDLDQAVVPNVTGSPYSVKIKFKPSDESTYAAYKDYVVYETTVTITKANRETSVNMDKYVTGRTPSTPSVTGYWDATATFYYNTTNNNTGGIAWTEEIGKSLEPGTYYMYAEIPETANYNKTVTEAVAFKVQEKSLIKRILDNLGIGSGSSGSFVQKVFSGFKSFLSKLDIFKIFSK